MKPELTNERAKREWLYILDRVGEERASKAMSQLGTKRPFPLNVARLLKLKLPEEQYLPELEEVKSGRTEYGIQALAGIKKLLK